MNSLLSQHKYDNLNAALLLQITTAFLGNYAVCPKDDTRPEAEKQQDIAEKLARHKPYLYKFYKNFQEHISDHQVWRLVCRIKGMLKEDPQEIKEAKMAEIRCI